MCQNTVANFVVPLLKKQFVATLTILREIVHWDLKLHVDADDKVSVSCEKKPGCYQDKPLFKHEQEQGITPRWLKPEFKTTRQFKYLAKKRDRQSRSSFAAPATAKAKKRKKGNSGDDSTAAPVTNKSGDRESSFTDMWKNAFKISYHGDWNALLPMTMPSPDMSAYHEIFMVRPSDIMMSEEDFVEGMQKFSQSVAMFHPEQRPIEIYRNGRDDSLLGCYLMNNARPIIGNVSERDVAQLLAYKPTEKEIADDCERSHAPFEDSTGACQRSLPLFLPLKEATANATHVQWDQMLDTGAVGTFMAASLAFKLSEYCSKGKDANCSILDMGIYAAPQRINGADPEAPNGMHAISWMKVRVNSKKLDGTTFTQEIKYDILNRTAVQDLRGIAQMSMDEGYLDIHNQVSGPNMRPEAYVLRMASHSSSGTVRLGINRRLNTWTPLVMVMLSDDIMWPKGVRLANSILKSSAESERDAMLKLDFDAVKDLEPCVQSQPALVIAACDAAKSADKDSEGATSETENDFDVSAEAAKIERPWLLICWI